MEISFLNDEGNCKNILLKHHLLKNYQIIRKSYSRRTILFIYCSEKSTSYIPKTFLKYFP